MTITASNGVAGRINGKPVGEPAILVEGLTKQYQRGKPAALDHLDLRVNRGEIFGYLGPNGAGKTTTIRLMLDIIHPSAGRAQLLGKDSHTDSIALHRQIGFLPGDLNLWDNMTGRAVVNYVGNIRGGLNTPYLNELTERLALDLNKSVRSYSTGNRRKLGLVLALMNKPELLILDEPTNGLDPLVQQTFHALVIEARNEGRTVFLSSHVLSEVQAICERVAILRDGKLQAVERVAELMRVKFQWITMRFREPMDPAKLVTVPGVSEITQEDGALRFKLAGDFDPVLRAISDHYVTDLHAQEPSLEEIFLSFYGDNASAHAAQPVKEKVS
jgi:ABC-2 type transport system ATP-binding protein